MYEQAEGSHLSDTQISISHWTESLKCHHEVLILASD